MNFRYFRILLIVSAVLILVQLLSCTGKRVVSLKSLLSEMTDRKSMTLYPDPEYKLLQFSSYDRRTVAKDKDGWFANDDYTQFQGVDSASGRKEYILFDTDGPGTIVRWWMTFAGEGSYDGTVRVYIDKSDKPVVEGNVLKVLSGQLLAGEPLSSSVSPLTEYEKRGHNLYLPVPFAKHCKITYQCDSIKINGESRKPSIYYNICYRKYNNETTVISFSDKDLEKNAALIVKTNGLLKSPPAAAKSISIYNFNDSIAANDSAGIKAEMMDHAISRLKLHLSAFDNEYALRSVVLKIDFDGIETVWVPAGDFFGTAYKATTSQTWNSTVDMNMYMESYWLMPFRKSFRISLVNYGDQEVHADLEAEVSDYKWKKNSMYFSAAWHEYHQILTAGAIETGGTGLHRDINFADVRGKGIYAGDAIAVYNTVEAWWGEGDEKIYVDGESFPSSIGTGTEDYYGYAWCRPELFSHPFIAQPSGSGNFHPGLTINMRYRDLDAIPFKSMISSNIELWHWLTAVINYSLTTYLYVEAPYNINIRPDIRMVRRPVPIDPEKPF